MIAVGQLDNLAPALRLTVREWLAGADLRARMPKSTFSAHRRALLSSGIDIAVCRAPGEALPACLFAEDCWDWLRPGDLAMVAELAFRDVQRYLARPIPDGEGDEGWFSREEFVDQLAHVFGLRLAELGVSRGLAESIPNAARDLDAWLDPSGSRRAGVSGVEP